jgi:hypothetical protein
MNNSTRYVPSIATKLSTCIVFFSLIILGVYMSFFKETVFWGISLLLIGSFVGIRGFFSSVSLREGELVFNHLIFHKTIRILCIQSLEAPRGRYKPDYTIRYLNHNGDEAKISVSPLQNMDQFINELRKENGGIRVE